MEVAGPLGTPLGLASLSLFTFMHWRRKWQPTPVFLPGESQGWGIQTEREGLPLGRKEPVSGQGSAVLLPGSGRGLAGRLAQAPPLTETGPPPPREVVDSHLSSTGPRAPRHLDGMLGVLVRVFLGEHLNL